MMPEEITWAIMWLALAIVFFVIESATVQLVCVWFAVGSLVAMLASFLGAGPPLQLLVFVLSSVAVLLLGRPFLKKKLVTKKVPTNADKLIGQTGVVLIEVDNTLQTGRVSADGLDWSARCVDDRVIPAREKVLVKAIEGVKLVVEPIE